MTQDTFNINAPKEILNLPDYDKFVETLRESVDGLSEHTPLGAVFNVDVTRGENGYKIDIDMTSQAVRFAHTGEGRSPYIALDEVIHKADDSLKVWAINRKL